LNENESVWNFIEGVGFVAKFACFHFFFSNILFEMKIIINRNLYLYRIYDDEALFD